MNTKPTIAARTRGLRACAARNRYSNGPMINRNAAAASNENAAIAPPFESKASNCAEVVSSTGICRRARNEATINTVAATAATAAGPAQRRSRSMIRSRPKVGVCYGACRSSP